AWLQPISSMVCCSRSASACFFAMRSRYWAARSRRLTVEYKMLYFGALSQRILYAHRPADVVEHVGSGAAAARELRLKSRAIVSYWLKRGRVPELRARQASEVSGGVLKFDPSAYEQS